ncbi:MAG: hypothetical protein IJL26_09510 [Clostridia bacterium]|nr:hypothetical protein [Clostridia bacterium]
MRELDLKRCLPEMLTELHDVDAILDALTEGIDFLEARLDRIVPAQFADTATDEETAQIASSLGLSPEVRAEDTRFLIRSVLLDRRPYTIAGIGRYLAALLGEDGFLIERTFGGAGENDRINVRVALGMRSQTQRVTQYLENVVPLNMTLTVELLYNRYGELRGRTWRELAAYTCGEVRSDRTIGETE